MNSREVYDEVRNRKIYDIDDSVFNHHIDGIISLVEEIDQARKIAHNIFETNKNVNIKWLTFFACSSILKKHLKKGVRI